MKKIDTLLKRVELFERLAVYGDRKSFLSALSQAALPRLIVPDDPNAPPGQTGTHWVDPNPQPRPQPNPPAPLPRLVVPNDGPPGSGGHWVDPNQPVVPAAKPPAEEGPQAASESEPLEGTTYNMPMDHITGRRPVQANPRVKAVQSFLNQQLTQGGTGEALMAPITEDGKWGPETARALKLWGDTKGKLSGVPLNAVFTAAEAQSSMRSA